MYKEGGEEEGKLGSKKGQEKGGLMKGGEVGGERSRDARAGGEREERGKVWQKSKGKEGTWVTQGIDKGMKD